MSLSIANLRGLLFLLLEVLWGYAAAALFVRLFTATGPGPSLVAVAAVVAGSAALARVLDEMDLDERSLRIAGTGVSVVALFAVAHVEYAAAAPPWDFGWLRTLVADPGRYTGDDPRALAGVLALALLWLRGAAGARRTDDFAPVLASAAFGLVAVALAAAWAPPARGPDLFGAIALAYLPLSLAVLALYQVAEPERPARQIVAQWGGGLAALVGAALALAVVAAAVDPHSLGVLAPLGKPLLFAVGIVGRFVLLPVFEGLAALFRLLLPPVHQQPPKPTVPQAPLQNQDNTPTPMWLRVIGYVLAGGALAAIGAVAAAILWSAFRRTRSRERRPREQRERVEAEQTLRDDLGGLLAGMMARFRRPRRAVPSPVAVRRLYHEMLARAADDGVERPASATPLQFAPRLDARYASDAPSEISRAFAGSRYGRVEFDDATVAVLRRRWEDARPRPGG